MKFLTLIFFLLCSQLSQGQESQSNPYEIKVKQFEQAVNQNDKQKMRMLLHEDFKQYYKDKVTIESLEKYMQHHDHGTVLNAEQKFKIFVTDSKNNVMTFSSYLSDRDRILGLQPFKAITVFVFQDQKIIKLIEKDVMSEQELRLRGQSYAEFLKWSVEKHNLKFKDYPFTIEGAKILKEKLLEFKKEN